MTNKAIPSKSIGSVESLLPVSPTVQPPPPPELGGVGVGGVVVGGGVVSTTSATL